MAYRGDRRRGRRGVVMQTPAKCRPILFSGAIAKLWNSINAKRGFSWDANPWVWVVEFELIS